MADGVYLCGWAPTPNGFSVWVRSRPAIRSEGSTFDEAVDRLCEAIQAAGGAMHAVMEFDPPAPKSSIDKKYSTPELFLIGGDEQFQVSQPRKKDIAPNNSLDEQLRWHDTFYTAPVCRGCKVSSSPRSEKPLSFRFSPTSYDGAFGPVGPMTHNSHQIISERFIALLSAEERSRLVLRPVDWTGRRKFFELVGPDGPPAVAVAGLKAVGWQCAQCAYRAWGYWVNGLAMHSFVAQSDLPASLTGVFTVGVAPDIQLAVTARRWAELLGQKGTRGFISRPLGVAPDDEVIRSPNLALREF